MARYWGFWTRGKLDLLRRYLDAFTTASKGQSEILYLDLFGGQPQNRERLTEADLDGSARIALATTDSPFSRLRFFELEPFASRLRSALAADFGSRDDVVVALPPSGNGRATLGVALRSIFQTLRARRLVFTNPTARLRVGAVERRQPLPVDVDTIRALLGSASPATAAVAALVVFHGLRTIELRNLCLVDVRDGHLHFSDRTIRLAEPVRERLGRWLDHRQARWPASANPHVFISHINAGRTTPVGVSFTGRALGMPPSALRADRILDEVIATGGDVRRLTDLFGLSVSAAVHYLAVLDPPGLESLDD